ncbi:DnaB-like helicase C-terminal domain-containing protein [Blastopirellula marina]|uniref:Probable replicative dna helicase protein n=1 Tax=Blastopirellula marina DSM 3645 TaxID=314230 RepID=A3ZUZ1_9BACT|nr:DnaB-like helicase C-terminal domain-containing protein [Blastopirellula marina]EAQ79727.1 probable replicative dna helicase protein [Blastopirellula marina DSM 3645]
MTIEVHDLKRAAAGSWTGILVSVAGIPASSLDRKHHPCPLCGGTDRFRLLDIDSGAVICNQCHRTQNGDGIATVMKYRNVDFTEAKQLIADHLGMTDTPSKPTKRVDLIERLAAAKSCPKESLIEYGAVADHATGCVTFPVFGEDRQQCSEFKIWPMAPAGDRRLKGLLSKGKPSGVFLPMTDGGATHYPVAGERWAIVEGCKDAASLHGLGYLACGTNGDHLPQKFTGLFQGVDVVLIPDRTTDAEAKAELSAARLAGVAKSVRIASLPLPLDGDKGDDCRDALRQKDGEKLLRAAIDHAKEWGPGTSQNPASGKRRKMTELVSGVITQLREHGETPKVTTGIKRLDDTLGGGMRYSDLVVIGGLSSHMKSGFVQQIGHHVTCNEKLPFAFLSLEMAPDALAERTIQYASDVPKENWHRMTHIIEQDANKHFADAAPFEVIECDATLVEVEAAILDLFKSGTKIVAVDYAQMIMADGRDDPNIAMRKVSDRLKQLAKGNDAIVIVLAQLRKDVENRKPLVPRLTDIEYGPKLGQNADVCLFVVWPHKVDPSNPPNEYQIFLEKQRNGPSKVAITCRFEPSRLRITEGESEYTPPESATSDNPWHDWNNGG